MKISSHLFDLFIHDVQRDPKSSTLNPLDYISACIYRDGYWEPYITKIFIEIFTLINKQQTKFIDIGANIGWYSLLAAKHNIRTQAFEPISHNYDCFQKTIIDQNLAGLITLHKLGIGRQPEKMKFFTYAYNEGLCGKNDWNTSTGSELVNITTLDLALAGNTSPLVVKIDAEEMELEVLAGAKHQVQYIDFLMIEIAYKNLTNACQQLVNYGFKYCLLVGSSQKINDTDASNLWAASSYLKDPKYYQELSTFQSRPEQVNLLCVKKLWL